MPYKTTGDAGNGGGAVPSDTDDFIFSKLIPFASDQGFVSNQAPAPGSAPNRECWIHQGTVGVPESPFIFIRTRDNSAFCFTGTGINTGEEIYDQPGNPCNAPNNVGFDDPGQGELDERCPVLKGSSLSFSSHHLFSNANGDYIHGVIQLGAREWRHIHYGKMPTANKYGTFTGGEYCFAHWWDLSSFTATDPNDNNHFGLGAGGSNNAPNGPQPAGFIRCDGLVPGVEWFINAPSIDSGVSYSISKFVGDVNQTNYTVGTAVVMGAGPYLGGGGPWTWGPSLIARTVPLIPMTVALKFNYAGQDTYGVIGTLPDMFFVNMQSFSPGETITIGSDSFIVFPVTNSNTTDTLAGEPYSGYYGIAYKIIP